MLALLILKDKKIKKEKRGIDHNHHHNKKDYAPCISQQGS